MRPLVVLCLVSGLARAVVPGAFSVEGVLRDGTGKLQSQMVNVTVSLWDSQVNGGQIGNLYGPTMVMAENGLFTVPILDGALPTALANVGDVWLEVTVGTDVFARQHILPQLSALTCSSADHLNGVLPITNGGTGSATKNFVDLVAAQTIGGDKTFSTNVLVGNSLKVGGSGAITANWWEFGLDDGATGTAIDFHGGTTLTDFTARVFRLPGDGADFIIDQRGGNLQFQTNDLTRMFIAPDGRVFVGGSLAGSAHSNTFITNSGSLGVNAGDELPLASIGFMSGNNSALGIRANRVGASSSWTTSAIILEMDVDNTVRANGSGWIALTASGGVGINTTTPDSTFTVNGSASKPGGGAWATYSDERLKDTKGEFHRGLDAVMSLQPIRYAYKKDNPVGIVSDGDHIGFSAQAVEKVIPEAVTRNAAGYRMVDNDPILWTMLNAIKDQQQEITRLRHRLDTLERRR